MSATISVYRRWMRDRRLSTVSWTLGIVVIIVATAAFYPSLGSATASIADGSSSDGGGEAMSSLLGLSSGIDPSSPLGYLWIGLYANIVPWTLMALGVALGTAAIASDEDTGALEYLLSGPVTRTQVAFARFAAAVSVLLLVSFLSGVSMILSLPFFDLTESVTTTAADGSTTTAPGATVGDIAAGTFSSFAVALGLTGIAFLIGAATGRKGITLGVASAIGIGGYVLYTLSSMTSSLDFLTWLSPWRWYVDDVMLINGLTWDVTLPFITATLSLLIGWQAFLHRDLQSS
jgi:ABC-2 type transport system permease protein